MGVTVVNDLADNPIRKEEKAKAKAAFRDTLPPFTPFIRPIIVIMRTERFMRIGRLMRIGKLIQTLVRLMNRDSKDMELGVVLELAGPRGKSFQGKGTFYR